jgi:endogenous inhibitor of DNA gyrase (YacG/DUF329 family)
LTAKKKHSLRGKKLKKKTIGKLKLEAWKWTSIEVRTRNADWKGMVQCVTCGKRMHWREAQAGHFIPGRRNNLIFDSRNIHVQCPACNVFLHGNLIPYYQFMQKTHGEKVIAELRQLNLIDKQFTREELEEIITRCKKLTQKWITN